MQREHFFIVILLLIFGAFHFAFAQTFDEESAIESTGQMLSPCDLLVDESGETLYVLEENAQLLRRVNLKESDREITAQTVAIPFRPVRMCWFPDQKRVAIVGGAENGKVCIVSVENREMMEVTQLISAGHSPSDVAVGYGAEEMLRLYVSNQFSGLVSVIDPASERTIETWSVGREPFALKLTPAGTHLVVAGLLPEYRADGFYTMSIVRIIETATGKITPIELLNGVVALRDIAISPDGKYAFITGTHGKYQAITSQVAGGWIIENVVTIIDIENSEPVEVLFLDDALLGAGNPWGIGFAGKPAKPRNAENAEETENEESFLVISISGTDELFFMPYWRIKKLIAGRPRAFRPGSGAYTYNYQGQGAIDFPLRLRVRMGLKGMRRLVAHQDTVYTVACFEDAIAMATIHSNPPFENFAGSYVKRGKVPLPINSSHLDSATYPQRVELEPLNPLSGVTVERHRLQLAPKPQWTLAKRGEMLFHDATICMEQWLSCATCHPDARVDGLNWDLLNDGVGNAKNTKSMLLSHQTPPAMISGVRRDAEEAVRAGVTHLLFNEIPEKDSVSMDEYLRALTPVPSPYLVEGELSPGAQRGRFLFESNRTNCSTCHPEPLFTDLRLHKTGSQGLYDSVSRFDTPTLIEVWRTAPYMNTGHSVTIRDLLLEEKHGNPNQLLDALTSQELDDLIEYVLSL